MKDKSSYKIYSTSKEAWNSMQEAISNAQKSIYWELYIFIDDEVGKPFFDILETKAKAGVDIKIIVDSFGSFWLSNSRVKQLKTAGVDIRFFHERKKFYRGWWKRLISRTHRKILIVDEKIGFIGGVNVQKHMAEWLDIQVRVEGGVVYSLLRAFAKMYIICGGDKKEVRHLLKYKFRVKEDNTNFVYDDPSGRRSNIRKKYTEAISKARERVILFSPYYNPDKKFLHALWKARKRGVKIDILIPFRSDVRIANYVSYGFFSFLEKIGVNVHLTEKMMHGKGVIVDDDWAMVGSSNIDKICFYDNYEANIHTRNKKTVKNIKNILVGWIKLSKNLKDTGWAKRGRLTKFKEKTALRLYKLWNGDK